jgi:hypothetical protein
MVSQILSETYDPPAGAAGASLTLSMQVEFSVLYASAPDLTKLAALALDASLPSGFSAPAEALTLEPVTEPRVNAEGSLRWTVRAERRIFRQISNVQVTQLIQGLGAGHARALLTENLALEAAPEIKLSPSWWPWIPIVPFRIAVVTEHDG